MFKKMLLALFVALLSAISLSADTMWTQPWTQDTSPVDKIEIFMISGSFGNPVISGLGPSWTLAQPNPDYLIATSIPASISQGYAINFGDPPSGSLVMDVLEWNGGSLSEHLRFLWLASDPNAYNSHYGNWSWNQPASGFVDLSLSEMQYNRGDASAVPEPGTLLLLGTSLVCVGFVRRKCFSR